MADEAADITDQGEATATVEVDETPDTPDASADIDAAYDAKIAELTAEPKEPAASSAKGPTPAAAPGQPETPQATQQTAPAAWTPTSEESDLLRRFHIDEQATQAMAEWPAESRTKFLADVKRRQDEGAKLYREKQELEAKLAAQAQQTPKEQPAAAQPAHPPAKENPKNPEPVSIPDEVLAPLAEYFDEGGIKALKALMGHVAKAPDFSGYDQKLGGYDTRLNEFEQKIEDARQLADSVGQMLYAFHRDQGLDRVRKLAGDVVKLDDSEQGRANLKRLEQHANVLLRGSFDPQSFNVSHALEKAFPLAFPNELQLAERRKLATSQHRALRGSPDPGGLAARTQRQKDADSLLDEAADEFFTSGAEAAAAVARRG